MKNKGKTWSRGTNSCLRFGVIVNLNLSHDHWNTVFLNFGNKLRVKRHIS